MIQSVRSGKLNIPEGCKAGTTSKDTEIKRTNVGRASREELLADYRDCLRVRDQALWDKNSREALLVREPGREVPQTIEVYRDFVATRPAGVIANIAICLLVLNPGFPDRGDGDLDFPDPLLNSERMDD